MGKSLTETARAIVLNEGGVPSISMSDSNPDRDTQGNGAAKAALRPGAGYADGRFANPGSTPPDTGEVEDLGPAAVTPQDENGPSKANKTMKSKKGAEKLTASAVAPQPPQSLSEDEDSVEISEELEAFINELAEQGLSEEEIAEAIEENFELVSEESEEHESKESDKEEKAEHKHKKKKHHKDEDKDEDGEKDEKPDFMKEHVDALLEGEDLSEEFRTKAETIFESAVSVRVNEELAVLEEAYKATLNEEVAKIHAELSEKIDSYLNYVVEQWIADNEVAIESGLRSEITEDFISGLRNLFAEHYIDVPDEKVSVIDELGSKVAELEAKLNEQIEKNVSLSNVVNESKQFEILVDACEGLTATQAEKLKSLAENVEFASPEDYTEKLNLLKESYFPVKPIEAQKGLDSDVGEGTGLISEATSGRMSTYVSALGKTKVPL